MLDLLHILTKARGVLAAVAAVTPIKSDDAFVALLDAVLVDAELFGWLERKVLQAERDGTLSLETDPPVAIQAALEARRVNWKDLLDAVPVIITLFKLFRS